MPKSPRPRRTKRARRSARQMKRDRERAWEDARIDRLVRRACWHGSFADWSRPQIRSYLWDAWEGRCHYCGVETWLYSPGQDQATIDHAVPKSRGGPHHISNVVLACYACNQLKGRMTADEFFAFGLAGYRAILRRAR